MKYLVLLLVLLVAYFSWRNKRIHKTRARKGPAPKLAPPQDMLECDFCGVHVPRGDALISGNRSYCCEAHQQQDAH